MSLKLHKSILITAFANILSLNTSICSESYGIKDPQSDISPLCKIDPFAPKTTIQLMTEAYTNEESRFAYYARIHDGHFFFDTDHEPDMERLFPRDQHHAKSLVELMMFAFLAPDRLHEHHLKHIHQTAHLGSAEAKTILGYLHYFEFSRFHLLEEDEKANQKEARRLFLMATQGGCVWGQYFLGKIMNEDKETEGFEILKQAGHRGHFPARQMLSQIGKSSPDNINNELNDPYSKWYWIKKLAKAGNMNYQRALSDEFHKQPNWDLVFKYSLLAAQQGDAGSQCQIGFCFLNGRGVEKDEIKALSWFQSGASRGSRTSCYNLGWLYEQSESVGINLEKAFYWYKLAADKGDGDACYKVAEFLRYAFGRVTSDIPRALEYYVKAQMIEYSHTTAKALAALSYATDLQITFMVCQQNNSDRALNHTPSDITAAKFPILEETARHLREDLTQIGAYYGGLSGIVSGDNRVSSSNVEFMMNPALQTLAGDISSSWGKIIEYLLRMEKSPNSFLWLPTYLSKAKDAYLDLTYQLGNYTLISIDPKDHDFMRGLKNYLGELRSKLEQLKFGIDMSKPYAKHIVGAEAVLNSYEEEVNNHIQFSAGLEERIKTYILAKTPQRMEAFWKTTRCSKQ